MSKIGTIHALEKFGRVRLSRHFFMRDFLYSEISNFHSIPNIPDDRDLAIAVGEKLCQELLDPLFETFGNISIRSAYRSSGVNRYGNDNQLNCAANASNYAGHIWDKLDANGERGATACIVIPWFADQYETGRDWCDLAWWIHEHLPHSGMYFHPIRAAFNLSWRDVPKPTISSYIKPLGKLLAVGDEPEETLEQRKSRYTDFPPLCGISYPINE